MTYIMQVRKSGGKNIFQSLKNLSFLEKIGLLEYALKIRVLGSYVYIDWIDYFKVKF